MERRLLGGAKAILITFRQAHRVWAARISRKVQAGEAEATEDMVEGAGGEAVGAVEAVAPPGAARLHGTTPHLFSHRGIPFRVVPVIPPVPSRDCHVPVW